MASERRALMGGPVHLQGNLNLHAYVQKKVIISFGFSTSASQLLNLCSYGYYCFYCRIGREVRANRSSIPSRDYVFPARQRNLKGGWVNLGSGLRIDAYSGKFKEHNGPNSDPASQDIDVTV